MKKTILLAFLLIPALLFAQKGKVNITVSSKATIQLNGKKVGDVNPDKPLLITVPYGKHKIKAVFSSDSFQEKEVEINKKEAIDLTFIQESDLESIEVVEIAVREEAPEEPQIYTVAEVQATFQGGDLSKFSLWVASNIQYPEAAAKDGISGRVYVQFVVDENGNVIDPKVLRSLDERLDLEAIRVVKTSPLWTPAKVGGKNVKQSFVVPISFKPKEAEAK